MAEGFHIGIGGPLDRLERRAHRGGTRSAPLLVAVTWGPLVVLEAAQSAFSGRVDPFARDLSTHARLLVALPLLLAGQALLDSRAAMVVGRLFDEGYVTERSAERVRALLATLERWRDRAIVEALLLVAAVAVGVAGLVGWTAPAGLVHGASTAAFSAPRVWYALVALPVFQLVMWRALYRFALWLRFVAALGGVPLRLLPAHADRRAGIGFVKLPAVYFGAMMLLALSAVLCAGWATRVTAEGVRLSTFRSFFFVLASLCMLVVFAPHLVLTPQLLRARIAGLRQYGALVSRYVALFHERWIVRGEPELLGAPDMQSLNDLSESYRQNVQEMSVFLFARGDWAMMLVAACLPVVPLLFVESSAHDVIKRLLQVVVGKMP